MKVNQKVTIMVYNYSRLLYLLIWAIVASSSEDHDFQTPESNKKKSLKGISEPRASQSIRASSVEPVSSSTSMELVSKTIRSQSVAPLGMRGLSILPLTRKK